MSTVVLQQRQLTAPRPIHNGWDELFLYARTKEIAGTPVTTPDFEADLHVESTTIMFADVVESVRLIERDERGNVSRIRALFRLLAENEIPASRGVILERRGDGLLAKFADARDAAACALALHERVGLANVDCEAQDEIALRIGLHTADVLADDQAIFGRGINLAARIMSLASPHETVLSATVRDQLTDQIDGEMVDLGECFLKHVEHPVRAYRLHALSATHSIRFPQPSVETERDAETHLVLAILPITCEPLLRSISGLDVLLDQMTAAFSQSPVLHVISRLSSNAFRGRAVTAGRAGTVLAAHYVLSGQAAATATGLQTQLELLHCASGEVVWSDEFFVRDIDVLSTESDVVSECVEAVMAILTATELMIAHGRPLPNVASHTLYLSAITHLHRFARSDFDRAYLMLSTLRERVPRHAAPAAWLARWHVFRVVQGWSDDVRKDGAQAKDYANRALDHDPTSSLALAMAGSVEAGVNRNMDGAKMFYDRALAHNPNEPLAWLLKSVAHGFLGDATAALDSSSRSLRLTPLDPLRFYYDSLSATAAMSAQAFELATVLANRAIRANGMHGSAYRVLAISSAMLGREEASRDAVQRLLAVEPGSTVEQFLARSAVKTSQNDQFAEVLAAAGLPRVRTNAAHRAGKD